jgi:hypothetical protein
VQAIYDSYFLDSRIKPPLNVYSDVVEYVNDGFRDMSLTLSLNQRLPLETLPNGDNFIKFVKNPVHYYLSFGTLICIFEQG